MAARLSQQDLLAKALEDETRPESSEADVRGCGLTVSNRGGLRWSM